MKSNKTLLQAISLALVACFLMQDLAWAAPEIVSASSGFTAANPYAVRVPEEWGHVRDAFRGTQPKLLIHIQDAHTNFSAQNNIANLIEEMIQKHGVRTVFLEGGTKDDSLTFLRPLAPLKERERVAMKYLRSGELNGAEYLNLATDHPMTLYGVEEKALYEKNLISYAAVAARREESLAYLDEIEKRAERLKGRVYPPAVQALDAFITGFEKKEKSFTEYYDRLSSEARQAGVNLLGYPHFLSLEELKKNEEKIDFEKANAEQAELFRTLAGQGLDRPEAASRVKAGSQSAAVFYQELLSRAASSGLGTASYPQLAAYASYLQQYAAMDLEALLLESVRIEKEVFERLLSSEDARSLYAATRVTKNLRTLLTLQATKDDFLDHQDRREDDHSRVVWMLAFLNRKLMDSGNDAEVLAYKPILEETLPQIEDFYRTTEERDRVMVRRALEKMEKENLRSAVLMTGGYHTPSLKELLRKENISYVVISPNVKEETNLKRYEKLLLGQLKGGSVPAEAKALALKPITEAGSGIARLQKEFKAVVPHAGARLTEEAGPLKGWRALALKDPDNHRAKFHREAPSYGAFRADVKIGILKRFRSEFMKDLINAVKAFNEDPNWRSRASYGALELLDEHDGDIEDQLESAGFFSEHSKPFAELKAIWEMSDNPALAKSISQELLKDFERGKLMVEALKGHPVKGLYLKALRVLLPSLVGQVVSIIRPFIIGLVTGLLAIRVEKSNNPESTLVEWVVVLALSLLFVKPITLPLARWSENLQRVHYRRLLRYYVNGHTGGSVRLLLKGTERAFWEEAEEYFPLITEQELLKATAGLVHDEFGTLDYTDILWLGMTLIEVRGATDSKKAVRSISARDVAVAMLAEAGLRKKATFLPKQTGLREPALTQKIKRSKYLAPLIPSLIPQLTERRFWEEAAGEEDLDSKLAAITRERLLMKDGYDPKSVEQVLTKGALAQIPSSKDRQSIIFSYFAQTLHRLRKLEKMENGGIYAVRVNRMAQSLRESLENLAGNEGEYGLGARDIQVMIDQLESERLLLAPKIQLAMETTPVDNPTTSGAPFSAEASKGARLAEKNANADGLGTIMSQAASGNEDALRPLGQAFQAFDAKQKDQALKILIKRAQTGSGGALWALGLAFAFLEETQKNAAYRLLFDKAFAGTDGALRGLGAAFASLDVAKQSIIFRLMTRKENADNVDALLGLGLAYASLNETYREEAYDLLKKQAQAGNGHALWALGFALASLTETGQKNEAFSLLKTQAAKDHWGALRGLGLAYASLDPVQKKETMSTLLTRAADGDALWGLGMAYELLDEKQRAEVYKVLISQARSGNWGAIMGLGESYRFLKDDDRRNQVLDLLQRGAEKGYWDSLWALSLSAQGAPFSAEASKGARLAEKWDGLISWGGGVAAIVALTGLEWAVFGQLSAAFLKMFAEPLLVIGIARWIGKYLARKRASASAEDPAPTNWFALKLAGGYFTIALFASAAYFMGVFEPSSSFIQKFAVNLGVFSFFTALADILTQWSLGLKIDGGKIARAFFVKGPVMGTVTTLGYAAIDLVMPRSGNFFNLFVVNGFLAANIRTLLSFVVVKLRTMVYARDNQDPQKAMKQSESFWVARVPSYFKNYLIQAVFPPHVAVAAEAVATQFFQLFYSWSVYKKGFMVPSESHRRSIWFLMAYFFVGPFVSISRKMGHFKEPLSFERPSAEEDASPFSKTPSGARLGEEKARIFSKEDLYNLGIGGGEGLFQTFDKAPVGVQRKLKKNLANPFTTTERVRNKRRPLEEVLSTFGPGNAGQLDLILQKIGRFEEIKQIYYRQLQIMRWRHYGFPHMRHGMPPPSHMLYQEVTPSLIHLAEMVKTLQDIEKLIPDNAPAVVQKWKDQIRQVLSRSELKPLVDSPEFLDIASKFPSEDRDGPSSRKIGRDDHWASPYIFAEPKHLQDAIRLKESDRRGSHPIKAENLTKDEALQYAYHYINYHFEDWEIFVQAIEAQEKLKQEGRFEALMKEHAALISYYGDLWDTQAKSGKNQKTFKHSFIRQFPDGVMHRILTDIDYHCRLVKEMQEGKWVFAALSDEKGKIELKDYRNPTIRDAKPQPISISLDERDNAFLLSGPNMGGKTTTARGIGFAVVANQIGLPLPTEAAELSIFNKVYTVFPHPEQLQAGYGYFGALIQKLTAIAREAKPGDLVVLDEVPTGTDYQELVAVTAVLLEDLIKTGATIVVTGHLKKAFEIVSQKTSQTPYRHTVKITKEGVRPDYGLESGIAQRSFAIELLERAGFPPEMGALARKYYEAITDGQSTKVLPSLSGLEFKPASKTESNTKDEMISGVMKNLFPDKYFAFDETAKWVRQTVQQDSPSKEDAEKHLKTTKALVEKGEGYLDELTRRLKTYEDIEGRSSWWGRENFDRKENIKKLESAEKVAISVLEQLREIESTEHRQTRMTQKEKPAKKQDALFRLSVLYPKPDDLIEELEDTIEEIGQLKEKKYPEEDNDSRTEDQASLMMAMWQSDWKSARESVRHIFGRIDQAVGTAHSVIKNKLEQPIFAQENRIFRLEESRPFFPGGGFFDFWERDPFVDNAVPQSVILDQEAPLVVITGPNSSGKTVSMFNARMNALLAAHGFYVSGKLETSHFDNILSFFGGEDNVQQGESYFFNILIRYATLLHEATPESLVILDELHGTDNFELAAIQLAVLHYLRTLGATVIFNTHIRDGLKQTADSIGLDLWKTDVLFNKKTGKVTPKYTLSRDPKLEAKSHGLAVAALSGLTPEQVERARNIYSELITEQPASQAGAPFSAEASKGARLAEENKELETRVREQLFIDITGITVSSTVAALHRSGILELLTKVHEADPDGTLGMEEIVAHSIQKMGGANDGYLHGALAALESEGYLLREISKPDLRNPHEYLDKMRFKLTEKGRIMVADLAPLYVQASELVPVLKRMQEYLFESKSSGPPFTEADDKKFEDLLDRLSAVPSFTDKDSQARREAYRQAFNHIEGTLVGPMMIELQRRLIEPKTVSKERPFLISSLPGNTRRLTLAFRFLEKRGFVTVDREGSVSFTEEGRIAFSEGKVGGYGVPASYNQTYELPEHPELGLSVLNTLLFGSKQDLQRIRDWNYRTGVERLVDRDTNIWGSEFAHKGYKKNLQKALLAIFNLPIERQPKFIAGMGIGTGWFEEFAYQLMLKGENGEGTVRSRHLETHPFIVLAADYNPVAIETTKKTYRNAGIPYHAVWQADIRFLTDFKKSVDQHLAALQKEHPELYRGQVLSSADGFFETLMLIHNRPFVYPDKMNGPPIKDEDLEPLIQDPTEVFVDTEGRAISVVDYAKNLYKHFSGWKELGRFGLLTLELYSVDPKEAAKRMGKSLNTSYMLSHVYSNQYLGKRERVLAVAQAAGLSSLEAIREDIPKAPITAVSTDWYVPAEREEEFKELIAGPSGARLAEQEIIAVNDEIRAAYEEYSAIDEALSERALDLFKNRDWRRVDEDQRARILLYSSAVNRISAQIKLMLGERRFDEALWKQLKNEYTSKLSGVYDYDHSQEFFKDVRRVIFSEKHDAVPPESENDDLLPGAADVAPLSEPIYREYPTSTQEEDWIRTIFKDLPFRLNEKNLKTAVRQAAYHLEKRFGAELEGAEIQVLSQVFFLNQGAFVIGRVVSADGKVQKPVVFSFVNLNEKGIRLHAVLTQERRVHDLFASRRSNFRISGIRKNYRETYRFLQSIMRYRDKAEIFAALGFNQPGKVIFLSYLRKFMRATAPAFAETPGIKGTVMMVMFLQGFSYAFKIIRDYSQKFKDREGQLIAHFKEYVKDKYRMTRERDRLGRELNSWHLKDVVFETGQFLQETLRVMKEEFGRRPDSNVRFEGDRVIFKDIYVQRLVTPLDVFFSNPEVPPAEKIDALKDLYFCIKELAQGGIYLGDLEVKQFGITPDKRVVSYDNDDKQPLEELGFIDMDDEVRRMSHDSDSPNQKTEIMQARYKRPDYMTEPPSKVLIPENEFMYIRGYAFKLIQLARGAEDKELFKAAVAVWEMFEGDLLKADWWIETQRKLVTEKHFPHLYPYPQSVYFFQPEPEGGAPRALLSPSEQQAVLLISNSFDHMWNQHKKLTDQAGERFEKRDWNGVLLDADARMRLYPDHLDEVAPKVEEIMQKEISDEAAWMRIKEELLADASDRYKQDLVLTYFYSVMRKVASPKGLAVQYSDDGLSDIREKSRYRKLYRDYKPGEDGLEGLVADIFKNYSFGSAKFEDLARDIKASAKLIARDLGVDEIESVEMLKTVFYRNKGAYLVGKIVLKSGAKMPIVFALLNEEAGVRVDAVLLSEKDVNGVFSNTRANFHVRTESYRELTDFLEEILPHRGRASLYSAIGFIHPGKIELIKSLYRLLEDNDDEMIVETEGAKGMALATFTLPSYPYVFKIVRDFSEKEGYKGKLHVIRQYSKVHMTDRVGRMLDPITFHDLKLRRSLFSDAVLKELQQTTPSSVEITEDAVVLKHAYVQRKVVPANLYLFDDGVPQSDKEKFIIDLGYLIKDLIAAGIFVGDYALKNFGITHFGKAVLYDFDDLETIQEQNYQSLPESENWYDRAEDLADPGVIYPKDMMRWLVPSHLLEKFKEAHADLFDPMYWEAAKKRLATGEIIDYFPYSQEQRLQNAFPEYYQGLSSAASAKEGARLAESNEGWESWDFGEDLTIHSKSSPGYASEMRAVREMRKTVLQSLEELSGVQASDAEKQAEIASKLQGLIRDLPVKFKMKNQTTARRMNQEMKSRRIEVAKEIRKTLLKKSNGRMDQLRALNLEAIRLNRAILKLQLVIAHGLLTGKSGLNNFAMQQGASMATLQGVWETIHQLSKEMRFRNARIRTMNERRYLEYDPHSKTRTFIIDGVPQEISGQLEPGDIEQPIVIHEIRWKNLVNLLRDAAIDLRDDQPEKAYLKMESAHDYYSDKEKGRTERVANAFYQFMAKELKKAMAKTLLTPDKREGLDQHLLLLAGKIRYPKAPILTPVTYKDIASAIRGQWHTLDTNAYDVENLLIQKEELEEYRKQLGSSLSAWERKALIKDLMIVKQWAKAGNVDEKQEMLTALESAIQKINNKDYASAAASIATAISFIDERKATLDRIARGVLRRLRVLNDLRQSSDPIEKFRNDVMEAAKIMTLQLASGYAGRELKPRMEQLRERLEKWSSASPFTNDADGRKALEAMFEITALRSNRLHPKIKETHPRFAVLMTEAEALLGSLPKKPSSGARLASAVVGDVKVYWPTDRNTEVVAATERTLWLENAAQAASFARFGRSSDINVLSNNATSAKMNISRLSANRKRNDSVVDLEFSIDPEHENTVLMKRFTEPANAVAKKAEIELMLETVQEWLGNRGFELLKVNANQWGDEEYFETLGFRRLKQAEVKEDEESPLWMGIELSKTTGARLAEEKVVIQSPATDEETITRMPYRHIVSLDPVDSTKKAERFRTTLDETVNGQMGPAWTRELQDLVFEMGLNGLSGAFQAEGGKVNVSLAVSEDGGFARAMISQSFSSEEDWEKIRKSAGLTLDELTDMKERQEKGLAVEFGGSGLASFAEIAKTRPALLVYTRQGAELTTHVYISLSGARLAAENDDWDASSVNLSFKAKIKPEYLMPEIMAALTGAELFLLSVTPELPEPEIETQFVLGGLNEPFKIFNLEDDSVQQVADQLMDHIRAYKNWENRTYQVAQHENFITIIVDEPSSGARLAEADSFYGEGFVSRGLNILESVYSLSEDFEKKRIPDDAHILLIGVGRGYAAVEMALKYPGLRITAINKEPGLWDEQKVTERLSQGSHWSLEGRKYSKARIKEALGRIELKVFDLESEQEEKEFLRDGRFDMVVFETHVLMYLKDKVGAVQHLFNERLKKNGVIAFAVENMQASEGSFETSGRYLWSRKSVRDVKAARSIVKKAFDRSAKPLLQKDTSYSFYLKYQKTDDLVQIPLTIFGEPGPNNTTALEGSRAVVSGLVSNYIAASDRHTVLHGARLAENKVVSRQNTVDGEVSSIAARLAGALKPKAALFVPILLATLTMFTLTPAEAGQVKVNAQSVTDLSQPIEGPSLYQGVVDFKQAAARLVAVSSSKENVMVDTNVEKMFDQKIAFLLSSVEASEVPSDIEIPAGAFLSGIQDPNDFRMQFTDLVRGIVQYRNTGSGRNDEFYLTTDGLSDAQAAITHEVAGSFASFIHFGGAVRLRPTARLIVPSVEAATGEDGTFHLPAQPVQADTITGWSARIHFAMTSVKYFAKNGKLVASELRAESVPAELLDAYELLSGKKPGKSVFADIGAGRAGQATLLEFSFQAVAKYPLDQVMRILSAARRNILGSA